MVEHEHFDDSFDFDAEAWAQEISQRLTQALEEKRDDPVFKEKIQPIFEEMREAFQDPQLVRFLVILAKAVLKRESKGGEDGRKGK